MEEEEEDWTRGVTTKTQRKAYCRSLLIPGFHWKKTTMQSLVIVSHLLLLSLKRKSRYELVLHHSCLLLLSLSGLLFFFFLLCFHENLCLFGDFLNTKITPKILSFTRKDFSSIPLLLTVWEVKKWLLSSKCSDCTFLRYKNRMSATTWMVNRLLPCIRLWSLCAFHFLLDMIYTSRSLCLRKQNSGRILQINQCLERRMIKSMKQENQERNKKDDHDLSHQEEGW